MQPPYTQQAYGQYQSSPSPSHNPGSGYPPHPGVTDFMTPVFSQRVPPSYNAPPYNTQDIYRPGGHWQPRQPAVRVGPEYGNVVYGGGPIPGYGSYHAMARSWSDPWGTPAPQPLQNGDYSMPSNPYSNHGQSIPYYTGHHFASTEQVPGFSTRMSFSPHLPEADPSSEWRFHTCWVNHAEEDETHLAYSNDAYGGGPTSGYGSNHAMAGSWGAPAPQPLQNSGYPMPNVPSSNLQPDEPYYAGYHFTASAEQFPGPSTRTSSSPHLPEADPNQDASSEWRFCQP